MLSRGQFLEGLLERDGFITLTKLGCTEDIHDSLAIHLIQIGG